MSEQSATSLPRSWVFRDSTNVDYPGLVAENSEVDKGHTVPRKKWLSLSRFRPRLESDTVLCNDNKVNGVASALPENERLLPIPRSSHRIGARAAAVAAITCLIVNVVLVGWLSGHHFQQTILVMVYLGSCTTMKQMSLGIHILINGLSTVLLAGSNYCMQCLCAPTRQDIDRNHPKGRFLDIGVQSLRNLTVVAPYKVVLWWILLLSSLPIHLLYNAAFYPSIAVQDYNITLVTSEFTRGGPVTISNDTQWAYRTFGNYTAEQRSSFQNDLANIQSQLQDKEKWEVLTPLECIRAYGRSMVTDRRHVLLVTDEPDPRNNTVLNFKLYTHYFSAGSFAWLCQGLPYNYNDPYCDSALPFLEQHSNEWSPGDHVVASCISELVPEQCSLNGNIIILIVVIACNLVKACVMIYVAFGRLDVPLLTIGDGIQSFLKYPDETTKGLCWMTKTDVVDSQKTTLQKSTIQLGESWPAAKGSDNDLHETNKSKPQGRPIRLEVRRWASAGAVYQWLSTLLPTVFGILVTVGLLVIVFRANENQVPGTRLFASGFGQVSVYTLIASWGLSYERDSTKLLTSLVLVSNVPQLFVSIVYYALNGLVTSMCAAREWSQFASCRKYLRVSSPQGRQTSSYYLSLPYRVGVPLMAYFGILHWIISQTFYPVVMSRRASAAGTLEAFAYASCGYSPVGMVICIIMGVVLAVGVSAAGCFGKLDKRARLVINCSAAISASCHAPGWDTDVALKRITYGALPRSLAERDDVRQRFAYNWAGEDRPKETPKSNSTERHRDIDPDIYDTKKTGHLCFTSGDVDDPQEDVLYA